MPRLPPWPELHEPEPGGCGNGKGDRPVSADRRAATEQRGPDRAIPARRRGPVAGRDLDRVQPSRHARGNQRPGQRRVERPDRVLENVMRKQLVTFLALSAAAMAAAPQMPRYRWENFTTAEGLLDNHVFNVKVDGKRV